MRNHPLIFMSAGDPSGDLHAGNLIRAMRRQEPRVEVVGYGGPRMAQAGCRLHTDLTSLAVMWLLRALLNLHKFLKLLIAADRFFRTARPDAVVLVDFPGFNWWIARRAKARGIPVFYYCPPQVWAWARWRVKKMRRYVDHVLCALEFEERWFRQRGCNTVFVGHPFFDEVRDHTLDMEFIRRQRGSSPLVAILPGSRTQEVTHNLRWFLRAAAEVRVAVPGARFAIASFKEQQARLARQLVAESSQAIEVFVGRTPELIHLADCTMAVSGSVSLELLYHTKPTVILYWISRSAYLLQKFFRKVKYITLVNLLNADDAFEENAAPDAPQARRAEKVLFPEYVSCGDPSRAIAAHIVEWLTDRSLRQRQVAELAHLKARVGHGGASQKAADYILRAIAPPTPIPRPHFLPTAEFPAAGVPAAEFPAAEFPANEVRESAS